MVHSPLAATVSDVINVADLSFAAGKIPVVTVLQHGANHSMLSAFIGAHGPGLLDMPCRERVFTANVMRAAVRGTRLANNFPASADRGPSGTSYSGHARRDVALEKAKGR